jgi:type IV pilus assembly protein PilM
MARSFPPDVIVLDTDGLLHARLGRGRSGPKIVTAKAYRLAESTFTPSMVTPQLANESSLAEALRRLRNETGKWERVSLLLPDSWFRINIMDLPSLPKTLNGEAMEMVRWSLKRTLPIPPEQLRVSYSVLSRTGPAAKVLAISAMDATLGAIERIFNAAGFDVILIEPVGLNIWNAITVREGDTTDDRLFVYVRDEDFTTAVFRGGQPLFIRSRNLGGDRTLDQELRLSASYLRDSLNAEGFANCYVAGARADANVTAALQSEFNTPVRTIAVRDYAEEVPSDLSGRDAELTACTGVFTG